MELGLIKSGTWNDSGPHKEWDDSGPTHMRYTIHCFI
jgi:hypothetical protein